jgi:hypothetical protein
MKKLTEEEFDEHYTLMCNHLDTNASFDGYCFETYGEELDYVLTKVKENRVITILETDGDDDGINMCYASGYHLVNRIGYLITEEEITEDFEVDLED